MPSRQLDPLNDQLQWVYLQNSLLPFIKESVLETYIDC